MGWGRPPPTDFPAAGVVRLELSPKYQFGGVVEPSRTVRVGSTPTLAWNSNTGRTSASPDQALDKVDVTIQYGDAVTRVIFSGSEVAYETMFGSRQALETSLEYFTYILPAVLNVDFLDSPVVEQTHGEVAGEKFGWRLLKSGPGAIDATTTERQEERLVLAWERSLLFSQDKNKRLLAGLHYFHVACRLERSGHSPSEFLPEIILNYAKLLEALFPPGDGRGSIDAARQGLPQLGFSAEEVEAWFIPTLVLRAKLDVAHASLAVYKSDHLDTVHRYCEVAESTFRELLSRVLNGVADGSYSVAPHGDLTPSSDTLRSIERISDALTEED